MKAEDDPRRRHAGGFVGLGSAIFGEPLPLRTLPNPSTFRKSRLRSGEATMRFPASRIAVSSARDSCSVWVGNAKSMRLVSYDFPKKHANFHVFVNEELENGPHYLCSRSICCVSARANPAASDFGSHAGRETGVRFFWGGKHRRDGMAAEGGFGSLVGAVF